MPGDLPSMKEAEGQPNHALMEYHDAKVQKRELTPNSVVPFPGSGVC
jgi:hypothetical protein